MFSRHTISLILTLNLLLGGIFGDGPRWKCVDSNGEVSVEDAASRTACCNKHKHDHPGFSFNVGSCCHDELIASGQKPVELQPAPQSIPPLALSLFFEPVLLSEILPVQPSLCADWTALARGAPPLSHLATVIILV